MNDMLKLVQALAAASIPNTEQEAVAGLRVEAAHVAFAERIYELFLRREGDRQGSKHSEDGARRRRNSRGRWRNGQRRYRNRRNCEDKD